MLIKIVPLYSECGVTKAVVTAYPEKDVTSCSSKYKYTGKLDEVHGVAEIVEFEPGKEDYHDYISYEDGLDLVKSDHRFIEKHLDD